MSEPRIIDCVHLGVERAIGCWQLGDTLVDPGPGSCVETLLAGIEGEPKRVLLTHIHLDHASATGALVERFPDLEVYVHEIGVPHMIDPSRLLASAGKLWDRMDELWGDVLPVPEANIRPLTGGETLDGGIEALHTPGHAGHHIVYLSPEIAFAGDLAGVRVPPSDFVLMPTPPPELDVEQWLDSIDALAERRPARLGLTHFGAVEAPVIHLAAARRMLELQVELGRDLDREALIAKLGERLADEVGAEAAALYTHVVSLDHIQQGLERYWRKRAEREAEAVESA